MNDIMERLEAIFRNVLADDVLSLRPEMTADDIEGWDSIAHVNLIFAMEEEFGIMMSAKEIENLSNVGDIVALIERKS